jgi:hypothetical protein
MAILGGGDLWERKMGQKLDMKMTFLLRFTGAHFFHPHPAPIRSSLYKTHTHLPMDKSFASVCVRVCVRVRVFVCVYLCKRSYLYVCKCMRERVVLTLGCTLRLNVYHHVTGHYGNNLFTQNKTTVLMPNNNIVSFGEHISHTYIFIH